jgi:hypothetical protein
MRPLSFTIEIPERPIYIPNSGPPMAPISLIPENEDTGWVIADTVDFQGMSQYIITPKDNPVHRRVVRKEHILTWVSAKAHEDYEYRLYKLREEEEKQREARLLSKAAELKARRWTQRQARRNARAKTRTAVLEQAGVHGGRKTMPISYSSTSDIDSEGPYKEISTTHNNMAKRKKSFIYRNAAETPIKRRAITTSGPGLLQQRMSQLFAGLPQRGLPNPSIADGDGNEGDDSLSEYDTNIIQMGSKQEQPHPDYRPILPPPKPTSDSSSSTSTQIVATSSSHASIAALSRPTWNIPGPGRYTNVELPKRSSSAEPQQTISSANGNERPEAGHGGIYLPILPTPGSLKTRPSSTEIASSQNPFTDTRKSRDSSNSPFGNTSQNVSGSNFIPLPTYIQAKSQSTTENPKPVVSKGLNAKHSSKQTPPRIESTLMGNRKLEGQDTDSRLNESHSIRTTTQHHQKNPNQTMTGSEDPAEQKSLSESDDNSESGDNEGDEEAWQIHGLLDDEMRLVNGDLIHYYLVDWVGDWDPTWEPETNVSSTAVKAYLKKQRDVFQELDGPANEVSSNEGKKRRATASGTHTNGAQKGRAASDSDEALVVSTSTSILLAPAGVPGFLASSTVKGKDDAEPE